MGLRATVYRISADAFAAAEAGDVDFDASEKGVDLDKAWHAIHYLITGDTELRFLVGGVQLPDVSETVEAHSPHSIVDLQAQLSMRTTDQILQNYDAGEFTAGDIYPGQWDNSGVSYIRPYLLAFADLVRAAASENEGFLVVLA